MFGLDDDDLLTFAPGRSGSLWSALLAAAKTNPRLEFAAATLRRWRAEADYQPPYEFFAGILDNEGMRQRMLTRLGAEAAEPIDEFLNLALQYDDRNPPSLQGFVTWLRRLHVEIKRDQDHGREEVRVMTVQGPRAGSPDRVPSGHLLVAIGPAARRARAASGRDETGRISRPLCLAREGDQSSSRAPERQGGERGR